MLLLRPMQTVGGTEGCCGTRIFPYSRASGRLHASAAGGAARHLGTARAPSASSPPPLPGRRQSIRRGTGPPAAECMPPPAQIARIPEARRPPAPVYVAARHRQRPTAFTEPVDSDTDGDDLRLESRPGSAGLEKRPLSAAAPAGGGCSGRPSGVLGA